MRLTERDVPLTEAEAQDHVAYKQAEAKAQQQGGKVVVVDGDGCPLFTPLE